MNNKELFFQTYLESLVEKFEFKTKKGDPDFDKAFEVYTITAVLDKTFDEVYNDVIIKGTKGNEAESSQDGGIDGVCFSEQDGYYIMDVFQCKNSKKLKQNQIEKFKNDFTELFIKGNINKPNSKALLPKIDEYYSITKARFRIEHRLNFIYNGNNDDNDNRNIFTQFNNEEERFFILDGS